MYPSDLPRTKLACGRRVGNNAGVAFFLLLPGGHHSGDFGNPTLPRPNLFFRQFFSLEVGLYFSMCIEISIESLTVSDACERTQQIQASKLLLSRSMLGLYFRDYTHSRSTPTM